MSSISLTIPNDWRPLDHQQSPYGQFGYRRHYQGACVVWYRRAGKDSVALNLTARDMFRRVGTYWHLLPEQTQARRALWNGIVGQGRRNIDQVFTPALRNCTNAQDMLIETANGSIWQMGGSDNYDRLVGSNPVGVVFSEWSLAHPQAWDYIRPILVENGGWALFIFTPRGRNHAWTSYMIALAADDWLCELQTIDQTGLITPKQIEAERRAGMSDGKIGQGFFCSFEAENDEQLIAGDLVAGARARELRTFVHDEMVIGVDVARFGDDHSVIYFRQGHDGASIRYERFRGWDTMQLAARVADWIHRWQPEGVFVDDGGVGGGVVDRLHQLGFRFIQGANYGARSDWGPTGEKAANKRTEMWLNCRDWLSRGALPDDERLAAELSAPYYSCTAQNAIQLERKADMKKRGLPSPDIADALALTFAYPVWTEAEEEQDLAFETGRSEATGY